jgi:hypothetical protein
MVKIKERKDIKKIEERENIKEEGKGISQTGFHKTVSTTPSSWWEDRKRIEQPIPEDQEKRYREEQERFKQEKQMRVEGEGENNMVKKIEERENIKEEGKGISQTGFHKTVSTTPSSWWEDRKRIEQPIPEDQEKRYSEEQERFKQERQRAEYYKSKQETVGPGQEHQERYEPKKQKRVEGEEKKDSYLKLYNPWFATEALFEKAFELSNAAPETYMEFQTLWMNTYQEAFGRLFDTPTFNPFMEPLKNAAKIYIDTFTSMSNIWIKSYNTSKEKV